MNPYRALIKWLGKKPWFATFVKRFIVPLDKRFKRLPFAPTTFATGLPMGYLTTRGRRTGEWRTVPLLFVETPEGHAAVVGTNFGGEDHPDWTYNLAANSKGKWQVKKEHPVRARPATDLEFMALWPQFVGIYPGYDGYVERSGRHPKMFILERRKS